jgi:hypothetical protein
MCRELDRQVHQGQNRNWPRYACSQVKVDNNPPSYSAISITTCSHLPKLGRPAAWTTQGPSFVAPFQFAQRP